MDDKDFLLWQHDPNRVPFNGMAAISALIAAVGSVLWVTGASALITLPLGIVSVWAGMRGQNEVLTKGHRGRLAVAFGLTMGIGLVLFSFLGSFL